jgi:hypothetical protein
MTTPSELFVAFEPEDPTDPDSKALARLCSTHSEALDWSPFVLTFADYMAMDDAPPLRF